MEKLDKKEQTIGTFLSIAVSFEIILPIYFLFEILDGRIFGTVNNTHSMSSLFTVVCLGGFLGGSTRALNRLIIELNAPNPQAVKASLSRWFLYLFKPFVGIGGGFAFFTATNIGLLTGISANTVNFEPLGVVLISFVGGMFFEDVFRRLQDLIAGDASRRTDA